MDGMKNVIPAASVVLIRDRDNGSGNGLEVLLLKRHASMSYLGGAWVFPGGHVDAGDCQHNESRGSIHAAFRAAVRETEEECGACLTEDSLIPMALWVTPSGLPKRFSTFFFLAMSDSDLIKVDGHEIERHLWMSPQDALLAQKKGDMFFAPPNFVTLIHLAEHRDVKAVMAHFRSRGIHGYRPRLETLPDGMCSIYEEDEEYDNENDDKKGRRHRLWMSERGWFYERNF